MSCLSQTERDELVAKARHMRAIAALQLDPRLRRVAQEIAAEYEQRASEGGQADHQP